MRNPSISGSDGPLAHFRMGGSRLAVVSAVLLLLAAACGGGRLDDQTLPSTPERSVEQLARGDQMSAVIAFPQHEAPLGTDRGGEYFAGRLIMSEGCLRAEAPQYEAGTPPSSYLLIWPNGFALESTPGAMRVVDESGHVVAQVGDHVRLSRATTTFRQAADLGLVKELSEDCREPFFLVGDEVTAFDPEHERTRLRLSEPEVLFLRERTVLSAERTLLEAAGVGELVLDGRCLRLKDRPMEKHWPAIVWPAGFTPHVHDGVVQIRNGAGRIVAEVGDEIAGGGGYFDLGPGECTGPVFRANRVKVLPDVPVYFPRHDGTLSSHREPELLSGRLILDGKCLLVDDDVIRVKDRVYVGISLLLFWPDTFALSSGHGNVGIVDATGNVVARVGDQVEFSAFQITYAEAMENGSLAEITPACSGAYWAVGEEFATAPAR